jgi:GGDEF domain-containing protein
LFGTICVLDVKATNYDPIYPKLLEQFKNIIEGDLELIQRTQALEAIAITDELTGLYNRRGFHALAQQHHKLALRIGCSMGLLYLDIDDLKEINDVIGHEAGDEANIKVAKGMQHCLRDNDISARIGGDEYVALVLLSEIDTLPYLW